MKVNFNNLRLQAIYAFDDLCITLNNSILKKDVYARIDHVNNDSDININGFVVVDVESIQKSMDNLRMMIGSIACVYEEGDDDFKCVMPENEMQSFNDPD